MKNIIYKTIVYSGIALFVFIIGNAFDIAVIETGRVIGLLDREAVKGNIGLAVCVTAGLAIYNGWRWLTGKEKKS